MKVLPFVMVPVVGRAIYLIHHQTRRAIWCGMVAGRKTGTRMVGMRHTRDCTLLEGATDEVAVSFVRKHDEGMRVLHPTNPTSFIRPSGNLFSAHDPPGGPLLPITDAQ